MTLPSTFAPRRRRLLWCLVANGAGQAVAAGVLLLLLRQAFDQLLGEPMVWLPGGWHGLGGALLMCAASTAWLRRRECIDAERLGQDYVQQLRRRLFRHLLSTSSRESNRRRSGAIMLRLFGDLAALRNWVSRGVARLAVAGVASAGMLGVLAYMDPWLTIAVGGVVAGGAGALVLVGPDLKRSVDESRRCRARLAGHVGDVIASMSAVQACSRARHEHRRMVRHGLRLGDAMTARAAAIGATRATVAATAMLATAMALMVGGLRVEAGATGPGSVVAAIGVVGMMVALLRDLGRVYEYWCAALVAREKIVAALRRRGHPVGRGNARLPAGEGAVRLARLRFGRLLRGIDASIAPGTRVLVTGANGAGKSTLLHLIAGHLRPTRGVVDLDGENPANLAPESSRNALAMVSMAVPPVRGSLRRNLRYGQPDASDEAIRAIIKRCGLDGLDARRITAGGANLSRGELQRLLLARALVRPPRVLLLDEVDVHLDAASRHCLRALVEEFRGTVIMVSHDKGWVDRVDEIWHLLDGRVSRRAGGRAQTTVETPSPQERAMRSCA